MHKIKLTGVILKNNSWTKAKPSDKNIIHFVGSNPNSSKIYFIVDSQALTLTTPKGRYPLVAQDSGFT